MAKYPKVRCPVCGMVVWFNNIVRKHSLDTFVVEITSRGRGRITNKYEKQPFDDKIIDFWINKLQEVIEWLKSQKKTPVSLTYYWEKPIKTIFPVKNSCVSVQYLLKKEK